MQLANLTARCQGMGTPRAALLELLQPCYSLTWPSYSLYALCMPGERLTPQSSGGGLPQGIRDLSIVHDPKKGPGKRTIHPPGGSVGKEDCCWKQQTVGLVPQQSLVTKTSLKCPVGNGVRGMDG